MPTETAVYALAFAILIQAGLGGYYIGRLTQRVKALEDDGTGHSGLALQFAEFKGEVTSELRNQGHNLEGLRSDLRQAFERKV